MPASLPEKIHPRATGHFSPARTSPHPHAMFDVTFGCILALPTPGGADVYFSALPTPGGADV
jgi:hypothetical protein